MFKLRSFAARPARLPWAASVALHAVTLVLVVLIAKTARPRTTFVTLEPPARHALPALPPYGGSARGRGPSGGLGQPPPHAPPPLAHPAPVALGKPDSTLAVSGAAVGPFIVTPNLADARVWPAPRPALPAAVAEALYNPRDTLPRDSVAKRRLRAMVDSVGRIIDVEQRNRRLPTWVAEAGGKKFGIDSTGIYIAGIKIPTAALALLGASLPQGNFDEAMRARQLADMREDMMQAARRTETLREFRQYVRELRARKQAEHDAERRQRGDTVSSDTTTVVP